jgi:hypothetical protein
MKEKRKDTLNYLPDEVRLSAQRSSSLDVLKCFAALFVVGIHFGSIILPPLFRCAVPLFFIITGYYYPMMRESGKFWQHIKKLLRMALWATALYALSGAAIAAYKGEFSEWLATTFQFGNIVWFILTNTPLFGDHLWYFWAVIYCLLIFYYADKWKLTKVLYIVSPFLFLALCAYNFNTTTYYYSTFFFCMRSFLFFGIPCMMVGRLIREGKDKWFSFLSVKRHVWLAVVFFICMALLEMYVLKKSTDGSNCRDMYFFTLPLVVTIFYWALRNPEVGRGSWLATIGRKYSAYIYIFHVFIHTFIGDAFIADASAPHWLDIFSRVAYMFILFGISLLFSMVFCKCVSALHH